MLLTGAYPRGRAVSVLRVAAKSSPKLERFVDRIEDLPEHLVRSMTSAEAVHQFGRGILAVPGASVFAGHADLGSVRLYARRAEHHLLRLPRQPRVYHYRAGFGGQSVEAARMRGALVVCDHSIAHPSALEHLIEDDGTLPPPTHRPQAPFWRWVLADLDRADHVVVNSTFVRDTCLHHGHDHTRVHTLQLGVDKGFLDCLSTCAGAERETGTLLFAGSFERRKGAHVLIEALARVDRPWRLTIAGAVSSTVRMKHLAFLRDPRVRLLGTISRADLARLMTRTQALVLPSLAEGSARVAFEALAAGCDVIVTPNTGSIVEHGVTGLLVAPGNAAELTAAIEATLMEPAAARARGEHAARLVGNEYRQHQYGQRLLSLLDRLADG